MTLGAIWVRQNRTLHELVVVADSRISGGESWDSCPKVVALPRPATVVTMAGDAVEAYAFVIQALNTCYLLDGHIVGRTDIRFLADSLRRAYADSRSDVSDLPAGVTEAHVPSLEVVLAGWSWRRRRFEAYSYSYNRHGEVQMIRHELEVERPYPLHFSGDFASVAKERLKELLLERGMPIPFRGDPDAPRVAREAFLDWEPLEILCDAINDPTIRTVGGVPQVYKIYENGLAEGFVWRDSDGVDHFGGRRVQRNERHDRRVMTHDNGNVAVSFSDRSVFARPGTQTTADGL